MNRDVPADGWESSISTSSRGRGIRKFAVAVLAGGSLFQTCETRLRDAFVQGTRDYISVLLNPANFLPEAPEE